MAARSTDSASDDGRMGQLSPTVLSNNPLERSSGASVKFSHGDETAGRSALGYADNGRPIGLALHYEQTSTSWRRRGALCSTPKFSLLTAGAPV